MIHSWEGEGVNDIYLDMVEDVMQVGSDQESRVSGTMELTPAIAKINNPRHRVVTAHGRRLNVTFALIEVLWILAGRRDVEMLEFYNSNIKQYSDDGKVFNAAYGYRLRRDHGVDQIEDVILGLRKAPHSRQATLVVSDPRQDSAIRWDAPEVPSQTIEAVPDAFIEGKPLNDTKDRACNVLAHLMIRNGKLNWMQIIRSNDLIWGTPYNWIQWTHLQEFIADALNVPMGHYLHVVDSLHIYDYHHEDAQAMINSREAHKDLYTLLGTEHPPLSYRTNFTELLDIEKDLRRGIHSFSHTRRIKDDFWRMVMVLANAHWYYKNHEDLACAHALVVASEIDPIYAACQAKFYWHNRWAKAQSATEQAQSNGIADVIFKDMGDVVFDWVTE